MGALYNGGVHIAAEKSSDFLQILLLLILTKGHGSECVECSDYRYFFFVWSRKVKRLKCS